MEFCEWASIFFSSFSFVLVKQGSFYWNSFRQMWRKEREKYMFKRKDKFLQSRNKQAKKSSFQYTVGSTSDPIRLSWLAMQII